MDVQKAVSGYRENKSVFLSPYSLSRSTVSFEVSLGGAGGLGDTRPLPTRVCLSSFAKKKCLMRY